MKNRIAFIVCYFGKLPESFDLWYQSAESNPEVDFLLFTDQNVSGNNINIKVYPSSMHTISVLAAEKLYRSKLSLNSPYKLCDFKPMYGVIFQDYLQKYSFWGICDLDMIWGNIAAFISDDILNKYEKLYQLGHLTLYRNTRSVNNRFQLPGYIGWESVVATEKHCRFCERGMIEKYKKAAIPLYNAFNYADISKLHKRMQLSHWLVPSQNKDRYRHQLFYYQEGHVYRAIYENGSVYIEEFIYIHLQKRTMQRNAWISSSNFFITSDSYINKAPGIPSKEDILTLNPYPGFIYERFECLEYEFRTRNILNRIVTKLSIGVMRK